MTSGGRFATPVAYRWVALCRLFLLELGGLSIRYDATGVGQGDMIGRVLGSADGLLQFGIRLLATLALYLGSRPDIGTHLGAAWPDHRRWIWLGAHGLAFATFWALCAALFAGPPVEAVSAAVFAAWLLAGFLSVALLLLAAVSWRAWADLLVRERRGLLMCALAAGGVWLGGRLARSLWKPLASLTLTGAHALLTGIYPVVQSSSEGILGTPTFSVEISPECSGYEGIWLVIAFDALYLWLFRGMLRFPAALALLPIGIVGMLAANIVRVAALIVVGTSLSPELAIQGFHSQAGWIGFTLIALGLVALSHRAFRDRASGARATRISEATATAPMIVPFLALTASTMLCNAFSAGFNALYPLGVVTAAIALWHFRGSYRGVAALPSCESLTIGVVVFAVWMWMEPAGSDAASVIPAHLARWPTGIALLWIAFRLVGSIVTVPIVEEFAFRGYLIRKLGGRSTTVPQDVGFTWLSLAGSSVLFGILHGRWLAGTLAGIGFACAAYRRGRVGDAVAAHMTTNALIALLVVVRGRWGLWS